MLLLAGVVFAQAPAEQPTFRAGVALVRVDAQVSDRSGHAIAGLTAEDFTIFDEGEHQKIVHFGRESEPLDLLLLLDTSGSMSRFLEQMAGAARTALQQLHTGDRVGVMLFARNAELREPLTNDLHAIESEIRDAVHTRSLGSGTAINAAIISAAQYLAKQPVKGRRAVLIVTDNQGLNYLVPDDDVIRELFAADAVLNGILIGKQWRPDPPKSGRYVNPDFTPPDIVKLSGQTGGETLGAGKSGESFAEMIDRIRSRYSMQYQAPAVPPGSFRRIRVQLSDAARARYRDASVNARSGYYAAP